MMRAALLSVMLASSVLHAADVTTCGQTILGGEVGTLVTDLDCTGIPAAAVYMYPGATLQMNGHTLTGGLSGVATYPGKRGGPTSRILGPGEITAMTGGSPNTGCAIFTANKVLVQDIDIHDNGCGIRVEYTFPLTLVDVRITDNDGDGVSHGSVVGNGRVDVRDSVISGNAGVGVVTPGRITLRESSVTDNGAAGVVSERRVVSGRNAVVTGNGAGGDVAAYGRAKLVLTSACDHSVDLKRGGTLGICAQD